MQSVRTNTLIFIERHSGIKNTGDLMALKAPSVEEFETCSRRPGHRQSVTISIDIMGNLGMSYVKGKFIADVDALGDYRVWRLSPREEAGEEQYVHFYAVMERDYQRLLKKLDKER